jgi:hypothetical protein
LMSSDANTLETLETQETQEDKREISERQSKDPIIAKKNDENSR